MATRGPSEFGRLLRRFRIEAGLSQEALAERAGLSPRGIQDLELGVNRTPREATVDLLVDALQLSVGQRATLEATISRPHRPRPSTTESPDHVHNLPSQPTAFIGREREVAHLCEIIRRREVHLLTVTGPGGVGKTRLTLEVARQLRGDFADGVFFVPLTPLRASIEVPLAIARALGLEEAPDKPVVEGLMEALAHKRVLLVLDNFEQVASAAPMVAGLLLGCEGLKVVVTSRAVLHVQGERIFSVPPLTLPTSTLALDPEEPTRYDAVRLFVERAQDGRPGFHLTSVNAPTVAEICRRLDGLPLAIELAAAKIRIMSPLALLARLDRRLSVLTGEGNDRPERQQTLRKTLEWSYDLLQEREQSLLGRLAIFVGSWTMEAAEAACAIDEDLQDAILDGIASLVDNNLVQAEEQPDGEMRFSMLETVGEFATEKLKASREAEVLRRQHAVYYLLLAELAEPELTGPAQSTWLYRLEQEHFNLRAALRWALDVGEAELGLRLAGALWRFWSMHGYLSEGRRWLEELLTLDERAGRVVPLRVRAKALSGAGVLAYRCGDYGRAAALFADSLVLYREMGDEEGTASALNHLGNAAIALGEYSQAQDKYEQSLALYRGLGAKQGIANVLNNLGELARRQGVYPRAKALYKECLDLRRE